MTSIVPLYPPAYYRTGMIWGMEARLGDHDAVWARCELRCARGRTVNVVAFGEAARRLAARGHGAVVTLAGRCRHRQLQATEDDSPRPVTRMDVEQVLDPLDPDPAWADVIAHQMEAAHTRTQAGPTGRVWPWETASA